MASPKRKFQNNDNAPVVEPQSATVLPLPISVSIDREPKPQPERIGDILRRQREKRGDDLQQIADYLCIRRSFLVALESSRYNEFPADAYVIGFLRSYAEYLGLDGKDAIDYYRQEMAGRRKKPVLSMPAPISSGRAPSAIILVIAAVAALIIYIVWYSLSTSDRATVSAPPALPPAVTSDVPTSQQPAASPPETSVAPPAPVMQPAFVTEPTQPHSDVAPTQSAPATTAVSTSHLAIKAEQSSWVLIADSKGKTIYDRVMKAGENYNVPNMTGLTLTTGNAAGIVLSLDGSNLPKFANGPAHIMRNIPIDADQLKNLPAAAE